MDLSRRARGSPRGSQIVLIWCVVWLRQVGCPVGDSAEDLVPALAELVALLHGGGCVLGVARCCAE